MTIRHKSEPPFEEVPSCLAPYSAGGTGDDDEREPVDPAFASIWIGYIEYAERILALAEDDMVHYLDRIPELKRVLRYTGFYAASELMTAMREIKRGRSHQQVWYRLDEFGIWQENEERTAAIAQLRVTVTEQDKTAPEGIDPYELEQDLHILAEIGRKIVPMIKTLRLPPQHQPRPEPTFGLEDIPVGRRRAPAAPTKGMAVKVDDVIRLLEEYRAMFEHRTGLRQLAEETVVKIGTGDHVAGIVRRQTSVDSALAQLRDPHGRRRGEGGPTVIRIRR